METGEATLEEGIMITFREDPLFLTMLGNISGEREIGGWNAGLVCVSEWGVI